MLKNRLPNSIGFSAGLILVLFAVSFFYMPNILSGQTENPNEYQLAKVARVIDGDTLVLTNGEKIRLLGIDAPERGEKCYAEAKNLLESLTLSMEIMLQSEGVEVDQYGRSLRWIYFGNRNINFELVKRGVAKIYFYHELKEKERLIQMQSRAKKQQIGCLWQ